MALLNHNNVPYSRRPLCYSHPYRLLLINKFCIYLKTLHKRTYSKAEVTWAEIEEKRIAQYLSDNISVIVISSYMKERADTKSEAKKGRNIPIRN